jgi:hypothetical protein
MTPRRSRRDDDEVPGERIPDEALHALFDQFGGRLISPGGAARMLGVTRPRVHELVRGGRLRLYRSHDVVERLKLGPFNLKAPAGPKWGYIPLDDVYALMEAQGKQVARVPPRDLDDDDAAGQALG